MSATDEHLMQMANDIAVNIRPGKTSDEAVEAIANHLMRFWTPTMRKKIVGLCEDSSKELEAEVRLAAKRLR